MANRKRKFCGHCSEYVSATTYRRHRIEEARQNRSQARRESTSDEVLPLILKGITSVICIG